MICLHCNKSFEQGFSPGDNDKADLSDLGAYVRRCPHCGARIEKPVSALLKTSTILISADRTEAVYHSMEDVPEPLREMLLQSTNSANSGTILIADRRGKEHISRAVRDLPAALQRVSGNPKPAESNTTRSIASLRGYVVFGWPLLYWAGLLLALVACGLAWYFSARRW